MTLSPGRSRGPRRPRRAGRALAAGAFLALPALLAGLAASLPARATGAEGGLIVGRVERVLDGARLVLRQDGASQSVTIRLAAVEAPASASNRARAAREALRACVGGRTVLATVVGADRHGQPVAMIDAGAQDCGLALLREGLARPDPAGLARLPVGDRHRYRRAVDDARGRRLGWWADPPDPPAADTPGRAAPRAD